VFLVTTEESHIPANIPLCSALQATLDKKDKTQKESTSTSHSTGLSVKYTLKQPESSTPTTFSNKFPTTVMQYK